MRTGRRPGLISIEAPIEQRTMMKAPMMSRKMFTQARADRPGVENQVERGLRCSQNAPLIAQVKIDAKSDAMTDSMSSKKLGRQTVQARQRTG